MKKVCLNLSESRALGDTLCSTPTIRKLYNSYNQKISIITNHKEFLKTIHMLILFLILMLM